MKFLRRHRLSKALDNFVMKLGPALTRRYGTREQYTVLQVSKTIQALKLSERHTAYAIAIFRHEESKNTISLFDMDQPFLNLLRKEIGDRYFDGNPHYSVSDVLRLSKSRGWQGGAAPNWQANRYGRTSL
ncbi:MAG: DUF6559 family protein [Pseudomonadota bacterium]